LAAGDAAEQIHLPKAVLCHDISLRFCEIFHRCSADVRYAPLITFDGDFVLETGQ
jgi:hypothetical protein